MITVVHHLQYPTRPIIKQVNQENQWVWDGFRHAEDIETCLFNEQEVMKNGDVEKETGDWYLKYVWDSEFRRHLQERQRILGFCWLLQIQMRMQIQIPQPFLVRYDCFRERNTRLEKFD